MPSREAIRQVGAALVASAGTVIVGLGMLYFSSFAKVKYTGPTIALELGRRAARRLDAGPGDAGLLGGAIFWPFRAPHRSAGADRGAREPRMRLPLTGFWVRVADLVVAYPAADPLGLPAGARCRWPWSGLEPSRTTTSSATSTPIGPA